VLFVWLILDIYTMHVYPLNIIIYMYVYTCMYTYKIYILSNVEKSALVVRA